MPKLYRHISLFSSVIACTLADSYVILDCYERTCHCRLIRNPQRHHLPELRQYGTATTVSHRRRARGSSPESRSLETICRRLVYRSGGTENACRSSDGSASE